MRDPIDRFISGFYEMKHRKHEMDGHRTGNKTAVLIEIRALLSSMMRLKQRNEFIWSVNKHLWPQLLFLIDKYGSILDFNYIGLLDNLNTTLPIIFTMYENIPARIVSDFLNDRLHQYRSRTSDSSYIAYEYITRADLDDTDVHMIRELYWLDYQCLFPNL